MVREDILGGLRLAVSRGEKLSNAMLTFLRAGYAKNDIEEAARIVKDEITKKKDSEKKTFQPASNLLKESAPQHVSSYVDKSQKKKLPKLVYLLISLIILLVVFGAGIVWLWLAQQ